MIDSKLHSNFNTDIDRSIDGFSRQAPSFEIAGGDKYNDRQDHVFNQPVKVEMPTFLNTLPLPVEVAPQLPIVEAPAEPEITGPKHRADGPARMGRTATAVANLLQMGKKS